MSATFALFLCSFHIPGYPPCFCILVSTYYVSTHQAFFLRPLLDARFPSARLNLFLQASTGMPSGPTAFLFFILLSVFLTSSSPSTIHTLPSSLAGTSLCILSFSTFINWSKYDLHPSLISSSSVSTSPCALLICLTCYTSCEFLFFHLAILIALLLPSSPSRLSYKSLSAALLALATALCAFLFACLYAAIVSLHRLRSRSFFISPLLATACCTSSSHHHVSSFFPCRRCFPKHFCGSVPHSFTDSLPQPFFLVDTFQFILRFPGVFCPVLRCI